MIVKRRICWPNPDATCLEGGCGYCNDGRMRSCREILRWVTRQTQLGVMVKNRAGGGEKSPMTAWRYGVGAGFYNVETIEG